MRQAIILCLVAAVLVGCGPTIGHLDPRKHGHLEAEVRQGDQRVTIVRYAPTPMFVEPRAKAELVDGEKRVTVEFSPRAKEARTFWHGLSSAAFGFLGGLFAR